MKRLVNVSCGAKAIEWTKMSSPPSSSPTCSNARSMLASADTSHSTTTSDSASAASFRTPPSSRSP
jgi:hypothetical protein